LLTKNNILLLVICTENKQDSQCTYNVTMRRVRATVIVVEKQ